MEFSPFSITTILVSHFLLDLQEANHAVLNVDPNDPLYSSRDPYDMPSFVSSLEFHDPDVPLNPLNNTELPSSLDEEELE